MAMINQLKQYRKARNLTQEQLAEALGISPRHVQRLEAGTNRLTPTIEKLLDLIK
jgi:transcriptional regulator with XRE-family HTH domain